MLWNVRPSFQMLWAQWLIWTWQLPQLCQEDMCSLPIVQLKKAKLWWARQPCTQGAHRHWNLSNIIPSQIFFNLLILLVYKTGRRTLEHSNSKPLPELCLFYFPFQWVSYVYWSTWTGMAHRLGHRNKNHMSWLVSMATKLLICPRVISPMDRLEVESRRILLYIIAYEEKGKINARLQT